MTLVAFGYLFFNLSLEVIGLVFSIRKLRAYCSPYLFCQPLSAALGNNRLCASKGCVGLLSQIMSESLF